MKEKYVIVFIIGIVSILLVGAVGNVFATDEELIQGVPFSFKSWFRHLFGLQDFSIVGDYRQCDRYPEKTFTYEYGDAMYVDSADYCSSGYGLINFFTGGWNPVAEKRDSISISSCNVPPCHIEVYCCPFDECDRDSDCEDWYGTGSECIKTYEDDPNIVYEYDHFHYCTEPSGIQVTCWYYPGSGESCFSRTYIGDEYCPSTYMGYNLYESKSTCEGNIPEEPINGNGNGVVPTNLDAVIYNINVPLIVEQGEEVIVEFDVKNKGDTGDYLIEAGIIPKSVAKDWGFRYAGEGFGIFDWLTQKNVECCEGQPNIFAKTTNLKSGEIDKFLLKIPQAPYSEIRDLCYDNIYWNGEGEYVLYIIVKTGCYPEGKDVTYETRIINIGKEEEVPEGEEPACRNNQEIFFTNAVGKVELKTWLVSVREEITPQIIDYYISGFSSKYFEEKTDACCENLTYIWEDSKEKEITPISVLLGIIGSRKLTFSYDIYKCVPEGEARFCLKVAHQLLNPLLHTDNCQTNTIILTALIIGLFLIISRFAGIYGEIKYEI